VFRRTAATEVKVAQDTERAACGALRQVCRDRARRPPFHPSSARSMQLQDRTCDASLRRSGGGSRRKDQWIDVLGGTEMLNKAYGLVQSGDGFKFDPDVQPLQRGWFDEDAEDEEEFE
jgi:hypothetical protein